MTRLCFATGILIVIFPTGTIGLEVIPLVIQKAEDIPSAVQGLKSRADAVYVAVDQLMVANQTTIATSALRAELPTILAPAIL